jgi:arylsulfatase
MASGAATRSDRFEIAERVLNSAHTISATIDVLDDTVEGVLVAHGSQDGGYSLYVQDGYLHYSHNYLGVVEMHVASNEPLPLGRLRVCFEFAPAENTAFGIGEGAPGQARLWFDNRVVAHARFPVSLPFALAIGGDVSIGRDNGLGISQRYDPPFEFTGTLLGVDYGFTDDLFASSDERVHVHP